MSLTPHRTVTSSALSRHSAEVFAAADGGAVEITRRDGDALVLLRRSELEAHERALAVAADLIAASLAGDGTPFVDRLADRFPWMTMLSTADREEFARSIVEVARACFVLGDFGRLLAELHEWRATALAVASGYTPDADLDWLATPVDVPDPRSA